MLSPNTHVSTDYSQEPLAVIRQNSNNGLPPTGKITHRSSKEKSPEAARARDAP